MNQSIEQFERRLKRVERDLAELKAAISNDVRPWYRQIVGVFAIDREFAQVVRLGRLARQRKING